MGGNTVSTSDDAGLKHDNFDADTPFPPDRGLLDALDFQLCDASDVEMCLARFEHIGNKFPKPMKNALHELNQRRGMVRLVPMNQDYINKLQSLSVDFPHMSPLIQLIETNLDLASMSGEGLAPLSLLHHPIVLDGPPGIGKTCVAERIAELFGTASHVIGGAELTNPFDITGISSGWGTGKPGLIARLLIEQQQANPVIVLDEVDKMENRGNNMSPCQALYSLFEEQSSKRFRDEYLGIEMDASRIFWICTANDISVIPSPIRDRVEVISLSMPSNEQCVSIAKSIYERACMENPWGARFIPELDDSSAMKLVGGQNNSIRDIQRVIDKCFALTAHYFRHAHSEDCISFSDDVITQAIKNAHHTPVQQRIGF